MTTFDDPNREAVGLAPIWSGAEGVDPKTDDGFDPGGHTVDDVKTYVEAYPEDRDAVLAAERSGKNRTTLVDWLEGE